MAVCLVHGSSIADCYLDEFCMMGDIRNYTYASVHFYGKTEPLQKNQTIYLRDLLKYPCVSTTFRTLSSLQTNSSRFSSGSGRYSERTRSTTRVLRVAFSQIRNLQAPYLAFHISQMVLRSDLYGITTILLPSKSVRFHIFSISLSGTRSISI